jgi:phage baseplate assembly protein W
MPRLDPTGGLFEDEERIRMAISLILKTAVGSRPEKKLFGVDFVDLEGKPISAAAEADIHVSAKQAITAFEKRVVDIDVEAEFNGSVLVALIVAYTEVNSGEERRLRIDYG